VIKLEVGKDDFAALAKTLRGIEFFSPLTVGQLDEVLPYVALYDCDPGEVVFSQGDAGDALYIIYRGRVSVRVKSPGLLGSTKLVSELGGGAFFGEIALLSREPRMATVVCEERTQLFALVSGDFQFVLKGNPALAAQMKRIAERRTFDSARQ
jgi:CRP-like cAMP-binding protein